MSDIIWEPSEEYTKNSNIKRFMDRHEIKHYDELIKRSTDEIEWFWPAMLEDCRVDWFKPWEKLMDSGSSKSFEWTKWFIGGKINIAYNSLVRHAKDQTTRNRPCDRLHSDWKLRQFSAFERSGQVDQGPES